MPVFKTGAINRSANSPRSLLVYSKHHIPWPFLWHCSRNSFSIQGLIFGVRSISGGRACTEQSVRTEQAKGLKMNILKRNIPLLAILALLSCSPLTLTATAQGDARQQDDQSAD